MALMQPVYSAQVAGLEGGVQARSGGLSFLSALLTLLVYVVLWAAVIRAVLLPERGGPAIFVSEWMSCACWPVP